MYIPRPRVAGRIARTATTVEGKVVKVGDYVGFKCDIEQGGRITAIFEEWGQTYLELAGHFHGEYIGGQTVTVQAATDCWID
jgi:hypothetical protein